MFDKLGQIGSKGAAAAKLAVMQRKIMGKKIVHEENGIKVVVSGDGKLKMIEVNGVEQKDVAKAVNAGIDAAQKWAAGEMQGMMGDLSKLLGK